MGMKTLLLEFLLCGELTGPDAGVDRGLCTDGNDGEEADKYLVGAFCKVWFGRFSAAVDKCLVATFNFGHF